MPILLTKHYKVSQTIARFFYLVYMPFLNVLMKTAVFIVIRKEN